MATNMISTYIPAQIPINQQYGQNVKVVRSSSVMQSQISPITHKDQLEQQVLYSHTPQRIQYSSSVDNLRSPLTTKDQPLYHKYPIAFTTHLNGINGVSSTSAIIQDFNYRQEQKESPYEKLNPLLTEMNPALLTDLDIKLDREKSQIQERKINDLLMEIHTLKGRLGERNDKFIKTDDENDNYKQNSVNLNVNVAQACAQFVMLCAENERLTYAYIQKEKETVNLQNEILQLKSNVLLEQTKQTSFPFAQQLDIEAKLKVFEMRNETLHNQKLELQNKEYDYLQQIEKISHANMVKEQKIQRMQSDQNLANIEVQNLTEQIHVLKRQYADLKETYEKQSSNLAQLDFQKLQSSQTTHILTEKENIIFQKNQVKYSLNLLFFYCIQIKYQYFQHNLFQNIQQEIAEFKNYIQILEKDVSSLQEKFNQETRKQMTVSGKYDQIHADLQDKYENHERLHNQLKIQYELQENELSKAQGHCELLLSENEKLSYALMARIEENEALKEEIKIQSRVQINYEESQTMINELKDNIDKLLEDNKTLYEVNRNFTSQQEQNSQNQKNMENSFIEKEKRFQQQINDLESRQAILNKQIQQKKIDETEIEFKNRNNEKSFKDTIYENEKLKSIIEIKEIKIKEMQFQIDEMSSEYSHLQQIKQEYQLLLVRSKEVEKKTLTLQEECNNWKVKYSAIESHQTSVIEELKYKVKNQCKEEYERELTWLKAKLEANETSKDQIMVKLASYEQKAIMTEHSFKDLKEKHSNKLEEFEQLSKEYLDRKSKLEVIEKQYLGMQEKHLLIRLENERLHAILSSIQKENEEMKRQFDSNQTTHRKQHSEVYARMQEYEEINRNLKVLISEYQDEIQKLEKINYNLKQSNFKIDEYENKILFLNREYEQIKLRLVETESQKQEFKIKFQESHNSLINYQQMDQQVSFLTKENERLQKLIMERCRQSGTFW